jgi:hypothetical protein
MRYIHAIYSCDIYETANFAAALKTNLSGVLSLCREKAELPLLQLESPTVTPSSYASNTLSAFSSSVVSREIMCVSKETDNRYSGKLGLLKFLTKLGIAIQQI